MTDGPRTVAICDASGFKCYADQLVRQWDGAMVLPRFCDIRNPQDFVTGVPDNKVPRITRPEAGSVFLTDTLTALDSLDRLTTLVGYSLSALEPAR